MNINYDLILSIKKVSEEYKKLLPIVQDSSQFTQELFAEWSSFKNRFHPVVWFLYRFISW